MNQTDTRLFVKKWNEAHGFEDGDNPSANMRYARDGVVTWNEYDAPEVDIEEFITLAQALQPNGDSHG